MTATANMRLLQTPRWAMTFSAANFGGHRPSAAYSAHIWSENPPLPPAPYFYR